MKRDTHIEVTARILQELENGALPWVKPWSATAGRNMPHNAVSGRPYSGANVVLLWMYGGAYPRPAYVTFKQAQSLGGTVRAGQHGVKIIFAKKAPPTKRQLATDPKAKGFFMLREYTVFNVAQCDGLPERIVNPAPVKSRNKDSRDPELDAIVADTGARISHGGAKAMYVPSLDSVHMPEFEAFKDGGNYYATMFHELGHWTGAKPRLNRDFSGRFGDAAYAAEELVAELCAAFLCAELGVDGELRHAGYIQHWIKLLKNNPTAFVSAAAQASKAAALIHPTAEAEPESAEAEPTAEAA